MADSTATSSEATAVQAAEVKSKDMCGQNVPCNVKDAVAVDNATNAPAVPVQVDAPPIEANDNIESNCAVGDVGDASDVSTDAAGVESGAQATTGENPKETDNTEESKEVGAEVTVGATEETDATDLAKTTPVVEPLKDVTNKQDNEVPITPVSTEKSKVKSLSPTAEPFVMTSNVYTPKKGVSSPIAIDTVDVSGGGLASPSFVTGNLPPVTPIRGCGTARSPRGHGSPRSNAPVSPNVELSAKQVRELRRLCRKTANRAEYEGRLVQLRQIASILAMGGPSLVHFAPSYLSAHSSMQAWLDMCRSDGADWRDERPLSVAAVEELREWDRLLKAWAKRRFPTLADCSEGSAPPTTPRSKRVDIMTIASPMSVTSPSPARALVAQQINSPTTGPGSARGNRRVSRISIETCGDSMNVSIIRTPDRDSNNAGGKSPWRTAGSPRRDQENVSPDGGDSTPRDWAALRKGPGAPTGTAADKNPVTPLKARNW